ncbi:MAG: hypothetical protein GKS00_20035 [Alphaproteobacteria bacterium]|nr:hypothetical protein [Alphaproteobacteria bacterium]
MSEELVISYPPPEELTDADFERMLLTRDSYTAMRDERVERERHAPRVGEPAPDFKVERLSGDGKRSGTYLRLSETKGRPVALIFGSYT